MGAQLLSGTPLGELYDRHVFPAETATEIAVDFDADAWIRDRMALLEEHAPGAELRAAIGRYALTAPTPPERRRREVVEARLPSHEWPTTPLQIVVVDAASGEPRVLTRDDGVSIVDAVAASCAVPGIWPPVTIGDRRYVDGGVRSTTNVDLAEGNDAVLLLAPVPGFLPLEPAIEKRLRKLEKSSSFVTIAPDKPSLEAFGTNPLDPATAPGAARAGRAQAGAVLDEVRAIWS